MSHGGARPGAGRKKGGANKVTEEAIKKAKEGGVMPLDFLLERMRDVTEEMARRVDCAKAAAQYVHPKLSSVEAKVGDPDGKPLAPAIIQLVGPDGSTSNPA